MEWPAALRSRPFSEPIYRNRRVNQDIGVPADFQIGHAVRVEAEVAAAGNVALEVRNAVDGPDPRDRREVDLVVAVDEVRDHVCSGGSGIARGIVGEGDLAGTGGQSIGAGTTRNGVVASVAVDNVIAGSAGQVVGS